MAENAQKQHQQLHLTQTHMQYSHQPMPQLQPTTSPYQLHHHYQQQHSPDSLLAALPESYMQSSTPQCRCPMHLQRLAQQQSPCSSPSSSLLSFSDSSASFSSELESRAASPLTVQLAVGHRRLRLMQREEGQLRRLMAELDSRLRLSGDAAPGVSAAAVDKDLLTLRRMSAESVLRTIQVRAAAQMEHLATAARLSGPPPRSPGGKLDSDSDGDVDVSSLLDF